MPNNKISQIKLPNNNEIYDIEGRNIQRISWSDYSNLSEEDKKSNTAYYITNIPLDEGGYKHEEGSVILIDDGKLNAPLEDCTVDINPVQDLHGYDHPWVGGAGKNKLPINAESTVVGGITFTVINENGTPVAVRAVGTATEVVIFNLNNVCSDIVSGAQYILTSGVTGDGWDKYAVQMCNVNTFATLCTTANGTVTANTVEGASYFARIIVWSGQTVDLTFRPMLRLATETDATFAPYSNICPISGWSGANIANISDVNAVEYFKGLTLGTYAFIEMSSLSWSEQAADGIDGIFRTSVPRTYGIGNFNLLSSRYTTYTGAHSTVSNIRNLVNINGNGLYVNSGSATFFCADSAYTDETVFKNSLQGVYLLYQLANPTTPTITPTQFNTLLTAFGLNGYMIPVSWQTEAGTIYGGELDVTSGVLTVTDGYIASYDGETLPSTWISDRDVYAAGTTPTTGAEVVYKLATPTEVSLTPTEITTLHGNNVIWADSGDMAITYTYESNNQIRMGDEIFSVGSNAQTISGHTVLTDVPADAVFTDTTYSVTPVTISTAQKGSDITVDDITAWNAGSVTTVTYNETTHSIIINNGVLPSLSYTAKNVPNITTENIQVVKDVSVVNSNITDG